MKITKLDKKGQYINRFRGIYQDISVEYKVEHGDEICYLITTETHNIALVDEAYIQLEEDKKKTRIFEIDKLIKQLQEERESLL